MWEISVDRSQLEHVSGILYLRLGLDEPGTDGKEYCRKVASWRKVTKSFQFDYARLLRESLFMSVLVYENETLVGWKKEKSRFGAVLKDNIRSLMGM